jgi:hypothetical protein
MGFTPKNVDDRTFEDLVAEAKRRIVAYNPEWTDHNESDPGITMMQLFAWLTETTLFRLNRVPDERMYVSFLNLMGVSPAAAASAVALVSFDVTAGSGARTYQPSELSLSASSEEGEVPFEPDAPVPLIGAAIGAVLVDDGISPERLDVTAQNSARAAYQPFGSTRMRDRALYLGLNAGATILPPGTSAEVQLLVVVDEQASPLVIASTSFGVVNAPLEGDLTWEAETGADVWQQLKLIRDETGSLKRDGLVTLEIPGTITLTQNIEAGDKGAKPRFWIRARAAQGSEPERRSILYVSVNGARARQWRTFSNELLFPGSDGTPRQERRVLHPPILLDENSLPEIEINEPDALGNLSWVKWTYVESLETRALGGVVQSELVPLRVFTVSPDRSSVKFGDGRDGLIPVRGANNIRVTYRSGGGQQGNVGSDKISLASSPRFVEKVNQPDPASAGTDEEPVADAMRRAPDELRAGTRAVTAKDFETIAENDGGAKRAIAVNRHNPMLPDVPLTGALTLVIVPPRIGDERALVPTQGLLDAVSRAVEPKRVLTIELFVVAPVYEVIDVDLELDVRSSGEAGAVRKAVDLAIRTYFDPVVGGPAGDVAPDGTQQPGEGWPLGGVVSYGELLSTVLRVNGVVAVKSMTLFHEGDRQPPCADVPLDAKLALVESGRVDIKINAPEVRR